MLVPESPERVPESGERERRGGADHDQAYTFGALPTPTAPVPFTMRQFARLYLLRTRLRPELETADDLAQRVVATD